MLNLQHGESFREGGEEGKEGATKDRKVRGSQISGAGKGERTTREKGEKGIQTECRGNIHGGCVEFKVIENKGKDIYVRQRILVSTKSLRVGVERKIIEFLMEGSQKIRSGIE